MPVHVSCDCGRMLVVPDSRRGHSVRCPRCARQLAVDGSIQAERSGDGAPPSAVTTPSAATSAVPPPEPPVQPPPPPAAGDEIPIVIDTNDAGRQFSKRDTDRQAVVWMAVAVLFVAVFNTIPVIISIFGSPEVDATARLERWGYGVLLISLLQVVYTLYLVQLPDWSSVWVVSLFSLLITTFYAALMGLRLLANDANSIMQFFELNGNRFSSGEEAGWCFVMVLLTGTFSFFAGRYATQWQHRTGAP